MCRNRKEMPRGLHVYACVCVFYMNEKFQKQDRAKEEKQSLNKQLKKNPWCEKTKRFSTKSGSNIRQNKCMFIR